MCSAQMSLSSTVTPNRWNSLTHQRISIPMRIGTSAPVIQLLLISIPSLFPGCGTRGAGGGGGELLYEKGGDARRLA